MSAYPQVTSGSLQQLLGLPALVELEVIQCDDSSDDEHNAQRDHVQLPVALDDLCTWFESAGRDLVVKHGADTQ